MIRRLGAFLFTALLLAGCGQNAAPSEAPQSLATTSITSPAATPTTSRSVAETEPTNPAVPHTPLLILVKYRSDPVDVANPAFQYLNTTGSSVVQGAWYDRSNAYLLIGLSSSVYHYCGVPSSTWTGLADARSRGSFFNSDIKGRYDCRGEPVPSYP